MTTDNFGVSGRIVRKTYDTDKKREQIPEWDDYDDLCGRLGETFDDQPNPLNAARIRALEDIGPEPEDIDETKNVVLDLFLTYIVDHIDPNQSIGAIDTSHLAVGNDDSSISSSDTGLGDEVYRTSIDSSTDNGKDLATQTLLDEGEANGFVIRELGLVSASSGGVFFNRSSVSTESKTEDKTITYESELQFRNA